jgi:hypothetical protein
MTGGTGTVVKFGVSRPSSLYPARDFHRHLRSAHGPRFHAEDEHQRKSDL